MGVRYKGWLAKTNKVFDQTKGSKTFNFRVGAALCPPPALAELAPYVWTWYMGCACIYSRRNV